MSLFTERLEEMLDKTNLFNRREWAKFLLIEQERISAWLEEESIPSPYQLNMILIVLENPGSYHLDMMIPQEYITKFKEMSLMPARNVSKFGKRMLPTVQEYMNRPIFSELSNQLARLSSQEQEELLEQLYPPTWLPFLKDN